MSNKYDAVVAQLNASQRETETAREEIGTLTNQVRVAASFWLRSSSVIHASSLTQIVILKADVERLIALTTEP